jgi:hypothetical protein
MGQIVSRGSSMAKRVVEFFLKYTQQGKRVSGN